MLMYKFLLFFVMFFFLKLFSNKNKKNVCIDYESYFNISSSSSCYYSADVELKVPTLLEKYTNISELHEVQTEDGYILTIFRIPRTHSKGVVLLQHCLTADANIWAKQENNSFAFILWYRGYEVWLSNNRGTYYSKKHIFLKPSDRQFWNFSFHEIGFYDHKAVLDYIVEKTSNAKIIFIGYSLGTTTSLVYSSLRPEESDKNIKLIIHFATNGYQKHMKSALIYCKGLIRAFAYLQKIFGIYSIGGYNNTSTSIIRNVLINLQMKQLFNIFSSLFFGWSPTQFDPKYYNLMFSHIASEMSWKTWEHLFQVLEQDGNFQMYDYGTSKNLKIYGRNKPLLYPVENIKTPIYFIYGKEDALSSEEDIEFLRSKLGSDVKKYGIFKVHNCNHLCYIYGKDTVKIIYPQVFKIIENLN